MRVSKEGDLFRGSHITGPTHNYLGMRVRPDGDHQSFDVRVLPPVGECSHGEAISATEAHQWISAGVTKANGELQTSYQVDYAEVVENDNRRPEVYEELARRIVHAAHEQGSVS